MMLVTAAIVENAGTVMIARRKKKGRAGGVWEFPGGKVEPGESPEDGLRRELREELGLDVRVGPFFGRFPFRSDKINLELIAFRVTIEGGSLVLNDHDEIRWVKPAELSAFKFADPDRPIVDCLEDENPK